MFRVLRAAGLFNVGMALGWLALVGFSVHLRIENVGLVRQMESWTPRDPDRAAQHRADTDQWRGRPPAHVFVFQFGMASFFAWRARSRLAAFRRDEQARQGRCTRCGYDLTGNTSGVCPECGTATATKRDA